MIEIYYLAFRQKVNILSLLLQWLSGYMLTRATGIIYQSSLSLRWHFFRHVQYIIIPGTNTLECGIYGFTLSKLKRFSVLHMLRYRMSTNNSRLSCIWQINCSVINNSPFCRATSSHADYREVTFVKKIIINNHCLVFNVQ